MGRWARVYLMNPPEKREQAVQELLRELEAESSAREFAAAAPSEAASDQELSFVSPIAGSPPTWAFCQSCGWENPGWHRFCGSCGRRLGTEQQTEGDSKVAAPPYVGSARSVQGDDSPVFSQLSASTEPISRRGDLSLFQRGSEVNYSGDMDEPHASPYRFVAGVALAAVILGLAYFAWRGIQTTQVSRVPQPTPPAVTNEPALPTPNTPEGDAKYQSRSQVTGPVVPQGAAANPVSHEQVTEPIPTTTPQPRTRRQPRATRTPYIPPVAGVEELAIARSYLSGTDGRERSSSEAAKWLWKATAKHNADATLLLSDLYLKGNGVPRNCDQARVLLDAAAIEGIKGAGNRLRHMAAFGCQ